MSLVHRLAVLVAARRVAIVVWAVLILFVAALVSYNRTAQARTVAALGSNSPVVRDRAVRGLVKQGRLSDVLASTQDPNSDAKSEQNLESITLRQNAAASVNALAASRQVSDNQALDALFLLRKDADTKVQDTATAGLATLGAANNANLRVIVGNLSNGDPDIRGAAVAALDKVGGDKVAKLVDPLMQSPEAQDSAQATMQGLGGTAVPYLLGHLETPNRDFRQKVLGMLGQIASPAAVPALVKTAADPDPSVRRLAQSALADTVINNFSTLQKAQATLSTDAKDPQKKPADILADKDAIAKAAASFAQTKGAAPALIATLRNVEADSQARTQSALALGRVGGASAVAALIASLGDYDALVRNAALQGVQSAGPEAAGALTAALAQGTADTRAAAAQALGAIGGASGIATLRALIGNYATSPTVRQAAVQGLGQSGDPLAVPTLAAALADPAGGVASAASDALLTPSLEAAAVPLLVASFGKPAPTPFNASQTLARMGNLPVPALRAAAASSNPSTQTWAAVTLGQTDSKDPGITAALTPLTRSANANVQYAATQALGRLAGS